MEARVELGRIRLTFDNTPLELLAQQQAAIFKDIGSAREVEGAPHEISCALSVHNFRKLRGIGCKLAQDQHTRTTVDRIRRDLDEYNAETARAVLAKQDTSPVDYTFKVKPLGDHQVRGFRFLHANKRTPLWGDVGCGKTFMVATFLDSLVKAQEPVVGLVVCPVTLVNHVWIEDVAKFTDLTAVSLREESDPSVINDDFREKGDPRDPQALALLLEARKADPVARKKARKRAVKRHGKIIDARFEQAADIYVINPEALRSDIRARRLLNLCRRLKEEGKTIRLILDEPKIKNRTSRTYKVLKKVRFYCDGCIEMTGTPSPNAATDLWAQFDILDGGLTLQPSFIDFRYDNCNEVQLRNVTWKDKRGKEHNATKWWPKRGAAMQIYKTIEPRMIRFRTKDCIDLPPKRFVIHEVEMNAEQRAVYEAMDDRLYAEVGDLRVTARVATTRIMKLREITGGFVIDDQKKVVVLGSDAPKMLALDDLLDQSIAEQLGDEGGGNKALIWAQYEWECETLVKRYADKYGARGLHGGISSTAKDESIRRFKTRDDCRLLVCHPASVGHGLNLTEACYAFYYSLSYNYEEFYQSHGRIARPGQKQTMTYYFLVSPGTIDEELIDALRAKKDLSDVITDGRATGEEILGPRRRKRGQIEFNVDWDPAVPPAAG